VWEKLIRRPLEGAIVEKLRRRGIPFALELHRTIHYFAALSRLITNVGRATIRVYQMDSQSRAFEVPFVSGLDAGTPLRCPRPMAAQSIVAWTPARILGALFAALVSAPVQLAPAMIIRRRA
jgi:hypothetical protein